MKRSAVVTYARAFWCALPLIEIYRSFLQERVEIGGLAVEELVLLIVSLSVLAFGSAYALKTGAKKRLAALFGALAVLFAFTLIHAAFAAAFNASLLPAAQPSFAVECYYVLRLYLAPFALLGGMVLLEITPRELMPAVKLCVGLFAGVIVVCSFTGLGYATYRGEFTPLEGSVFDWFHLKVGTMGAPFTVKGFFSDANALSAVFFVLSPLVFREALSQRRKWYDLILCFAVVFAGIAVGTRVGSVGVLLMLALSLVVSLVNAGRCKAFRVALRRAAPILVTFVLLAGVLFISPGFKMQLNRAITSHQQRSVSEAIPENDEDLLAYVEEHGWDHYIDKWFPELYSPEEDPAFWREVLTREGGLNQDNRRFKTEIIARIIYRDGRAGDLFLGIGRTSGVPYSERDLVFQVQIYGILGAVLLLLPFAGAGVVAGVTGVKRFLARKDATLPMAVCASFIAAFAAAYFSGHVFDTTLTTYILLLPAALAWIPERREA